jgi:hypothetical protein
MGSRIDTEGLRWRSILAEMAFAACLSGLRFDSAGIPKRCEPYQSSGMRSSCSRVSVVTISGVVTGSVGSKAASNASDSVRAALYFSHLFLDVRNHIANKNRLVQFILA